MSHMRYRHGRHRKAPAIKTMATVLFSVSRLMDCGVERASREAESLDLDLFLWSSGVLSVHLPLTSRHSLKPPFGIFGVQLRVAGLR